MARDMGFPANADAAVTHRAKLEPRTDTPTIDGRDLGASYSAWRLWMLRLL
jgi:hypothetical protein